MSYNDGLASLNGAAGINFYAPDHTMSNTTVRGNTLFAHATWPVLALAPGTVSFGDTLVIGNAVVALGAAPLLQFNVAGQAVNFSSNAYWSDMGVRAIASSRQSDCAI